MVAKHCTRLRCTQSHTIGMIPFVTKDRIIFYSYTSVLAIGNLTELDLSRCNLDFTNVIVACPQLRRLNLQDITTLRVEDLQVIATCYYNLQGLNLMEMPMGNTWEIENTNGKYNGKFDGELCISIWEVLSSMRLTHLSIDPLSRPIKNGWRTGETTCCLNNVAHCKHLSWPIFQQLAITNCSPTFHHLNT